MFVVEDTVEQFIVHVRDHIVDVYQIREHRSCTSYATPSGKP